MPTQMVIRSPTSTIRAKSSSSTPPTLTVCGGWAEAKILLTALLLAPAPSLLSCSRRATTSGLVASAVPLTLETSLPTLATPTSATLRPTGTSTTMTSPTTIFPLSSASWRQKETVKRSRPSLSASAPLSSSPPWPTTQPPLTNGSARPSSSPPAPSADSPALATLPPAAC